MYTIAVAVAMAVVLGERNSARRDGLRRGDASMRVGQARDESASVGDEMAEYLAVGRGGWIADGA